MQMPDSKIIDVMDGRGKAERLCKAEIFAPGRYGGVELVTQGFVAFVFGEIEFCKPN